MFKGSDHEEKFNYFLIKDKTHPQDIERISMFYLFSGHDELADKVYYFYDFEEKMIRSEGLNETRLSSSSKSLVKLGFNLYNNYKGQSIVELFENLDEQNRILALNAIKMRFKMD